MSPRRRRWREPLDALLVAVLLALFARTFVVQAFRIPTGSMEPSLVAGDHLLVNKFVYGPTRWGWERRWLPLREPRGGDVVVFRFPRDPRRDFVKRIVGLPGQRVQIARKRLSVDGAAPAEGGYVRFADARAYPDSPLLEEFFRRRDNYGPQTVPEGAYFVLGDNRDLSEDSRFWGAVPRALLKGRALAVYWSWAPPVAPPVGEARPGGPRGWLAAALAGTRWQRTLRLVR